MSKLQLQEDSLYSVSRPPFAAKIRQHLVRITGENSVLTDCCANVGGDTIELSRFFRHVNAIEIIKKTYDSLCNNVAVYKRNNVDCYLGDCLEVLKKLRQDVIYVDAPWGGRDYKKETRVELFLGEKRLDDLLPFFCRYCKYLALKVPKNVHLNRNVGLGQWIEVEVCRKFTLMVLKVK